MYTCNTFTTISHGGSNGYYPTPFGLPTPWGEGNICMLGLISIVWNQLGTFGEDKKSCPGVSGGLGQPCMYTQWHPYGMSHKEAFRCTCYTQLNGNTHSPPLMTITRSKYLVILKRISEEFIFLAQRVINMSLLLWKKSCTFASAALKNDEKNREKQ